MQNATNTREMTDERQKLKLGAILAIVGGLSYFILLLLHGDLPDQTTELALEHIASRPEWRVLKLALIASLLCWLGALAEIAQSLGRAPSRLLANWAVRVAIVGSTVVVVEYAFIGHALKGIADAWAVAPTGAQAQASLHLAETILTLTGGLFHSFMALVLGLPFVLLGLAIALEGQDPKFRLAMAVSSSRYPRWMGWIAILLGAGPLMAGATRFVAIPLVPYPLLYGGFVVPLTLWLTAMGALMWLRASKLAS